MNLIYLILVSLQITIELSNGFKYPAIRRNESVIDDYFGTKVSDPYRWLENPDSIEVKKFIADENSVTKEYIQSNKYRNLIKQDIHNLYNYSSYGLPEKVGSKYYFTQNRGLLNQDIYYSIDSIDSNDIKEFLDPNQLSSDGTTSVAFTQFSADGKYCAYGLNRAGSDWTTIKIRDTQTLKDLADLLTRIKYTSKVIWTHDNLGFFYNQYDEYKGSGEGNDSTAVQNQKLYYHRINTNQSQDIKVLEFPEHPDRILIEQISPDGKYIYCLPMENSNNAIYFAKLPSSPIKSGLTFTPVHSTPDAEYRYITADDNWLYLITNKNAPNYRIVKINVNDPAESNWINVVNESKTKVLKFAVAVNHNQLAVVYMQNVIDSIEIYNLTSATFVHKLNTTIGTVIDISGSRDDSNLFYKIVSFVTPGVIYRYDFKDNTLKIFRESKTFGVNANDFVTKQVYFRSKDNRVDVPLFVVHRKNISLDGSVPTLLYSYGGFNSYLQPMYQTIILFFINNVNGVFAMANIRGGGEYGESWHKAGIKTNKQNVFDDFASAAEYLIKSNYTRRDRLTILGYSNGGLLMGASSNQRPDLFGCTIANVGVMDMIRFPLFTAGVFWTPEYGYPQKNKTEFEYIYKYSPLHNIPKNATEYPATLILTADHDDRVVPAHSYKFAAQLQYTLGSKLSQTPLMIRIDSNSGHFGGKPVSKWVDEYTDVMCFILNSLKIDYDSRKQLN